MQQFYLVNERKLTCLNPLTEEMELKSQKNYLFDLSYLGILSVSGDNSAAFLQGQLSTDIREVSKTQMRTSALCNLKGRVLALMDVIDDNGFKLILPKDLLESTEASLAKTAIFSKVKLKAEEKTVFGFYLANTEDTIPFNLQLPIAPFTLIVNDLVWCYHLTNQFYIIIVASELADSIQNSFPKEQQRGSLAWHALKLKNNQFEIYPLSRGLFLPHRLNLQNTHCLSFNKGCYKGQEIIARTHYRAKLKHGMQLFTIKTATQLSSGQRLLSLDKQVEIGEIIDLCPIADQTYLIAISALFEHPAEVMLEGTEQVLTLLLA